MLHRGAVAKQLVLLLQCCGFPLLGAGLKEKFQTLADNNIAAVLGKGAKRVIFSCPSCFQMWRERFPRRIPIARASRVSAELLKQKAHSAEEAGPDRHVP